MADVVDADELLRRIRVARDWAAEREAGARDRASAGGDPATAAASADRAAYAAVRQVLDRIISPGTHAV